MSEQLEKHHTDADVNEETRLHFDRRAKHRAGRNRPNPDRTVFEQTVGGGAESVVAVLLVV